MTTSRFGILCGLLFSIILSSSPRFAQTMELDIDRPGMDYKSFDLASPDPNLCERACKEDPQNCKAWTYVKPGIQGPKARCWLKSGVPPAVKNTSFKRNPRRNSVPGCMSLKHKLGFDQQRVDSLLDRGWVDGNEYILAGVDLVGDRDESKTMEACYVGGC